MAITNQKLHHTYQLGLIIVHHRSSLTGEIKIGGRGKALCSSKQFWISRAPGWHLGIWIHKTVWSDKVRPIWTSHWLLWKKNKHKHKIVTIILCLIAKGLSRRISSTFRMLQSSKFMTPDHGILKSCKPVLL